MNASDPPSGDDLISIPLHPKHWVVIVGAIDMLNEQAMKRVDHLRRQGVDHSTLPHEMITALASPAIVRGILVKELAARGIMTAQANQQVGIDKIMDAIKKFRDNV